jgi:hypothetical protein
MTRRLGFWLTLVAFLMTAASYAAGQSDTQSLGDYARALQKGKPAAAQSTTPKVYDNDNLPRGESLNVVGDTSSNSTSETQNPAPEAAAAQGKEGDQSAKKDESAEKKDAAAEKKDAPAIVPGQSAEERQKIYAAWKAKLDDQKKKIDSLSGDLDLLQREYHVKEAEFYGDTALRVQNPNGFTAEDAKYKAQIAEKQKALDDAKAKLVDMHEDARKAGVPSSALD